MISDPDREKAVELINEVREHGVKLKPVCDELNISVRTYQRWTKEGEVKKHQRPLTKRPTPKNKITEEERIEIIETVNSPEHTDLAPSQIVRKLADEGKYIASESAIYRILEEKNECSPQ
ncbi:helix-turn-helix domain-containing protein [Anaerosalibacter massiliensis]|nr:helix-turn-helix domain-containing protein [Anaerosalibacter massiliensis]